MVDNFLIEEETMDNLEDINLDALTTLSKTNMKNLNVEAPTINEARFLIDNYYQIQNMRIVANNQLRALDQGADNKSSKKALNDEKISTTKLLAEQYAVMEANAKKLLDSFIESNYLSRWASRITGIGPVLAASLAAYLTIKEEEDGSTTMHAGSWWSYCGLTDNSREWLGTAKSKALVEQAIKDCGGKLDDETMVVICGRSQWKLDHFKNFKGCYKENKSGKVTWDKEAVIRACSVIPYNKELKVVCHKIGQSFHKVCNNDKSLYGRLFKERLQYETMKNERGDYAEQAAQILKEKNFSNKDIKEVYESGKLPVSHIYKRCERWATKLFISHAFEAAYWDKYHKMPPQPYIMAYSDLHYDYVGPECPYDESLWK